jgi:hypothetical protein
VLAVHGVGGLVGQVVGVSGEVAGLLEGILAHRGGLEIPEFLQQALLLLVEEILEELQILFRQGHRFAPGLPSGKGGNITQGRLFPEATCTRRVSDLRVRTITEPQGMNF